ncbi:MAG TPA: hypothetical protein ENK65_02595 [Helicobacteraceae bacterium]|nr:hypothetical protein [Helicobacteraceae bacterium]
MSQKTRLRLRKIAWIPLVMLSGCAGFSVNAQMCDAYGPNEHNLPQECYHYSEEEAKKASYTAKEAPCNDCSQPKDLQLDLK